jgi:hypothetical protein
MSDGKPSWPNVLQTASGEISHSLKEALVEMALEQRMLQILMYNTKYHR